ncbi:translation initiation factor IF-2-like [Ursus arctos]|uniref:translation initiation factor IF-2-like n=1 Tax=Ursus arctos TaxID=9644 RepID=UPI002546917C|nr:translation initiation factor IF-2-like [Ursus arctos]
MPRRKRSREAGSPRAAPLSDAAKHRYSQTRREARRPLAADTPRSQVSATRGKGGSQAAAAARPRGGEGGAPTTSSSAERVCPRRLPARPRALPRASAPPLCSRPRSGGGDRCRCGPAAPAARSVSDAAAAPGDSSLLPPSRAHTHTPPPPPPTFPAEEGGGRGGGGGGGGGEEEAEPLRAPGARGGGPAPQRLPPERARHLRELRGRRAFLLALRYLRAVPTRPRERDGGGGLRGRCESRESRKRRPQERVRSERDMLDQRGNSPGAAVHQPVLRPPPPDLAPPAPGTTLPPRGTNPRQLGGLLTQKLKMGGERDEENSCGDLLLYLP